MLFKIKSYICALIAIIFLFLSLPSIAEVMAQQEIILDFPVINVIEVQENVKSVDINPENGFLAGGMEVNFNISTNNEHGSIAEFKSFVDTTAGPAYGFSGNSNQNKGKIVLTNNNALPDISSVNNALSQSAVTAQNPNSIAYEVSFFNKLGQKDDPVFSFTGDNTAKALVVNEPGSVQVSVKVNNNSLYNNSTFSSLNDNAGIYQATIYCTVYSP